MARTIAELAKDIQLESQEVRPNLATIRRCAQQIEKLAPAELDVWSRMGQKANEAKAQAVDATKLLEELVTLKRMREQMDAMGERANPEEAQKFVRLSAEYHRRKPLAWAAAMLLFPEQVKS